MILIITAMKQEAEAVIQHFELKKQNHERLDVYTNDKIILCIVGIGKVQSAISTTELLITFPNIKLIINSGVAGALDPTLKVGEVVIGKSTIPHDAYIPEDFVEETETDYTPVDLKHIEVPNTKYGNIMTGDQFIDDLEKQKELFNRGGAVCDMECFAIAKVAKTFDIPCMAIKSISDNADGSSPGDFQDNLEKAINSTIKVLDFIIYSK